MEFLFLTSCSILLENSSGSYVANSITYLLTFYVSYGTLEPNRVYKREVLYLLPKTLQKIQLNKTDIIKSE